jgi:hypothetical protein
LQAVIDRNAIPVGLDEMHRIESMGIVQSIYALGPALVLRVPKVHPDAVADAYTGMIATPAPSLRGCRPLDSWPSTNPSTSCPCRSRSSSECMPSR